jgi:hypothetical protein
VILIAALFVAIYSASEKVLLLIAALYTLSGVVFRIGAMFRRRPQLPPVENV